MNGLLSALRREKAIVKSCGTGTGRMRAVGMPSKVCSSCGYSSEHIEFETQVREEVEQTSTQGMAAPRKRQKKRDDERLDATFQILTKVSASVTQKENNELQVFGNLVAKKLNKYSLDLQTSVIL
ncbi:hypothetical protein FQR65_LT08153 [Abscondita terminalis]|nr:hypothetical protein FQR65_LT08153 [Abscondita terminalis]